MSKNNYDVTHHNPIHFISDTIGYYITYNETDIAIKTPAEHNALEDRNQLRKHQTLPNLNRKLMFLFW